MKKVLFALSIISSLSTLQSCKKMCDHRNETPTPIVQSVDVAINENANYSYTLPAGSNFRISSEAAHALTSQLVVDGATGSFVYQYTPAANYVGTDEIVLSSEDQQGGPGNCIHPTNGKPNPNGPGCQGPHNAPYIITIHLMVNNTATKAAKISNISWSKAN